MIKKLIVMIIICSMMVTSTISFADDSTSVTEIITLDNDQYEVNVLSSQSRGLTTVTVKEVNGTESAKVTYNTKKDVFIVDGVEYPANTTYDYSDPNMAYGSSLITRIGVGDYYPVHLVTITKSLPDAIGELGTAAMYLAGFIAATAAVVSSAGFSAPAIITSAKTFLSSLGVGITADLVSRIVDGKITFAQYRTYRKVDTGFGKLDYMYRFDDIELSAKIKWVGGETPTWRMTGSCTSWKTSSKPY